MATQRRFDAENIPPVDPPIGFAVIGAGLWGQAHAEVFAGHPHSRLAAVCDLDERKARILAERFQVPFFTDAGEMLRDPEIQAVGIATPDFGHRSPTVAAAEAGKHILLEKPLATTLEDARAIEDAVTANGVRIMVDFHARWNPPIVLTRQSILQGQLGRIVSAYFRLNDIISVPMQMLSWAQRSSILWFLGSHTVDTLRWLIDDEVERVFSVSRSGVLRSKGVEVPDIYQTILEFRGGVIATIENNWIVPNTQPNVNDIKLNVLGSEGMVDIDLTNHGVMQLFRQDRYDQPDVFVKPEIHGKHMGFAYESIRDFVDRLAAGQPFVTDLVDGINVTRTILAIMESAEKRQPVTVRY